MIGAAARTRLFPCALAHHHLLPHQALTLATRTLRACLPFLKDLIFTHSGKQCSQVLSWNHRPTKMDTSSIPIATHTC